MNRRDRRLLGLLGLVMLIMVSVACSVDDAGGTIPVPPGQPTPCPTASGVACQPPPPVSAPVQTPKGTASTSLFSVPYFDPWSQDTSSSSANTVVLVRDTDYGQVSAEFLGGNVSAGTTASALLNRWTQQNLDSSNFSSLQDAGPIAGAEIGYVAGAGNSYEAMADLPNAPNTPLFLQVMAATQGTTGIIFVVVSPLDPANPDPSSPRAVRNGSYDRLVNLLTWTTT
jgi:hypothetical protein